MFGGVRGVHRRRVRRAGLVAAAVVMVLSAVPLPASGGSLPVVGDPYPPGDDDCGSGADTPPAVMIGNGATCLGSTYGEVWKPRTDARCPFPYEDDDDLRCAIDELAIPATDGDLVVIDMDDHAGQGIECGTFWWSPDSHRGYGSGSAGNGYASGTQGRYGYVVKALPGTVRQRLYVVTPTLAPAPDGKPRHDDPNGDCGTGEDYAVTVHVAGNRRPEVVSWTAPTQVQPAETASITIHAVDQAGGELTEVGVRAAPGEPWHPPAQWVPVDENGTATVDVDIRRSVNLELVARDEYTAESAPVALHIDVAPDDCDTGTDVALHPMALDTSCRGHLSAELGDDTDSYVVDVPAGTAGVAVDLALLHPDLRARLSAVGPDDTRLSSPDGRLSLPADPGRWTLEIDRIPGSQFNDRSSGAYELTVVEIGTEGPPVIQLVSVPSSVRAWHPTDVSFRAIDPTGRPVHFEVDWGDGFGGRHPGAGSVASGQLVTLRHEFEQQAGPAVVTITAVAIDGQRSSAQFEVATRPTFDDCAGWSVLTDAAGDPDPVALDPGRPIAPMPTTCSGELGHGLHRVNEYLVRRDHIDVFEVPLDATRPPSANAQPVRFTFVSLDDLSFDLEVRSLTGSAVRPVLGDVVDRRHVPARQGITFTWDVVAPNERFVVVVRQGDGSGPGSYRFTARQVDLLADF